MKKGVWNVENPLALSELFSEGIFRLPETDEDKQNAKDSIQDSEIDSVKTEFKKDLISDEPVVKQPEISPLPNLEQVVIVNFIYEEADFNARELVGNIIKAVKIPGYEWNAQTVKFVNVPQQTAKINNDILLATLNHYPQLRLLFFGLNSSQTTEFHQLQHPKALVVDMPSFMAQSVAQKKLNWDKIQDFFGMK